MLLSSNRFASYSLALLLVASLLLLTAAHRNTTPAPCKIVPPNAKCQPTVCANQSSVWCNCGGVYSKVPLSGMCNSSAECYLTGTDCQCHWKYDFCGCTQLPSVCLPSECAKQGYSSCTCKNANYLPHPTNASCSALTPIYGSCFESGEQCSCSDASASSNGNFCNCTVLQHCFPSQCEKQSYTTCVCDNSNYVTSPHNGTCKSLDKLFGQCDVAYGQTCKCSSVGACDCIPIPTPTPTITPNSCIPAQCAKQSYYNCQCGNQYVTGPPKGTCESLNGLYGSSCYETYTTKCTCSLDGTYCNCTSTTETPPPSAMCNPDQCALQSYKSCICDGNNLTPPENKTCKALEELYTQCDEYGQYCNCPTNGTSPNCNCTYIHPPNRCYPSMCSRQSYSNCQCGEGSENYYLSAPKNGTCDPLEPLYGPCYQTGQKCGCGSNNTCDCVSLPFPCNPEQCAAQSYISCSCSGGVNIAPPKNVTCQMLASVYGECYESGTKCECGNNGCNCTYIPAKCIPDMCAKQSYRSCQCGNNYLTLPPSGSCKELEPIYGACYQTGTKCECNSQQPSSCYCYSFPRTTSSRTTFKSTTPFPRTTFKSTTTKRTK